MFWLQFFQELIKTSRPVIFSCFQHYASQWEIERELEVAKGILLHGVLLHFCAEVQTDDRPLNIGLCKYLVGQVVAGGGWWWVVTQWGVVTWQPSPMIQSAPLTLELRCQPRVNLGLGTFPARQTDSFTTVNQLTSTELIKYLSRSHSLHRLCVRMWDVSILAE